MIAKQDLSQVPGIELNDQNFKVAIKLEYMGKKLLGENFEPKFID
jgi:hypothetical protein